MPKSIYSDKQEELCAMLIAERNKAGLSQSEVGRRLGKYQPYVARYETGERRLDVVELLEVAKAVGFSASKLVAKLETE